MNKLTAYTAVQSILKVIGIAGGSAAAAAAAFSPEVGGAMTLTFSGITAVAELMSMHKVDKKLESKLRMCFERAAITAVRELDLDKNKSDMLIDLGCRLEYRILNNELDSLPDDVFDCGAAAAKDHVEYLSSAEMRRILKAYTALVYIEVSKQPEPASLLTLQSLERLRSDILALTESGMEHTSYLLKIIDLLNSLTNNTVRSDFVITNEADEITDIPASRFIGREDEMVRLLRHIEDQDRVLVVNGIGGIGKTTLCRYIYADLIEKHKKGDHVPVEHIGYLSYNNSIDETVYSGLKYSRSGKYDEDVRAAWDTLYNFAESKRMVLFVDNVGDCQLGKLSRLPCAVVLTSRLSGFDDFLELRIETLSTERCVELFVMIYDRKPEDYEALTYVIEKQAACHTMTVKHLAHIAKSKNWSVGELKQALLDKGFEIIFKKDKEKTNIQSELEKLFEMADLSESEINVLEAFSMFPYMELQTKDCHVWLDSDADVTMDDGIYNELYQKGWLERNERGYKLHPVMAETIRTKQKPCLENHRTLVEACGNSLRFADTQHFTDALPYIPFGEALVGHMACKGTGTPVICNQLGEIFSKQGLYLTALEWYHKALAIGKGAVGSEHPYIAAIYNNIGVSYTDTCDSVPALEYLFRALILRKDTLGEKHVDTAMTYSDIGRVCAADVRLKYYNKALELLLELKGKECPETARVYNNIGHYYAVQKKFRQALDNYTEALEIRKKVYPEGHIEIARSYNNIGGCYSSTKEYTLAKEHYDMALETLIKNYGPEHQDVARSHNNIGVFHANLGEHEKALEHYTKALKIRERLYGKGHRDTAITYNNMGNAYLALGVKPQAAEYLERAIAVYKRIYGDHNEYTTKLLNNLQKAREL